MVEVDGRAAGRLYVARWADEIRIVDIALLPDFRGHGIGTALLTALQREAATTRKLLTIHVELFNPARSLYRRLGFQPAGEHGVHLLMRWQPPGDDGPPITAG